MSENQIRCVDCISRNGMKVVQRIAEDSKVSRSKIELGYLEKKMSDLNMQVELLKSTFTKLVGEYLSFPSSNFIRKK
jgi:hypothetical protein